jgi:serine/threonine protein kinase
MNGGASTGGEEPQSSPWTPAGALLSRFQSAWRTGQRPRVEDFLPDWADPGHSALLRGLVTLEVAYRLRQGEKPTTEEYRARFPGQGPTIDAAFQHPAVMLSPGRSRPTPGAAMSRPEREPNDAVEGMRPVAAAHAASAADLGATRRFGDYELMEKIGRDEVGVFYRARQVSVDRIVVVKLILTQDSASDTNVQQFYHDTRAVAALDHPGIVPIFDVGQLEGQPFVSMGYIEGETLAKKRTGGGLGLREGVEVIRQVAETIAYAHSKGVAHHNLTPKNVLLNARGRPKVTGFSSWAPLPAEGSLTPTGRVMGTPGYLAPEQAREGQEVGPAADIHALGAVLYFVLTGQPPFRGANLVETLLKVLHRDPKPPRQLNPEVPPELEVICLKCLQKRPPRRYPTAAKLAEDLGRWLRNEPTEASPESPISRSARLLGQLYLSHPRASIAVAGGLAALVLGVTIRSLFKGTAEPREPSRTVNLAAPSEDAAVNRRIAVPQVKDPTPAAKVAFVPKGESAVPTAERKEPESRETERPVHKLVPPQPIPTRPPTTPVSLGPPPAEIPLPGEIDDLAVGGDHYLVLAFRDPPKLLIFDAATATILKQEISLTGKAFVAAGSKTFVVVCPEQGLFQTWEFANPPTMKKAATLPLLPTARIEGIAMGSHSDGPLLVVWDVEPPARASNAHDAFSPLDPRVRAVLVDPKTLQPIPSPPGSFGIHPRPPDPFNAPPLQSRDSRWFVPNPNLIRYPRGGNSSFQVRASAQGDLFTISAGKGSVLMAIWKSHSGRSVRCFDRFGGQELLIPAPDGRRALSGNNRAICLDSRGASVRESDLDGQMATTGTSSVILPTSDPAYYLRFDTDPQAGTSASILLPTGEVL